MTEFIQAILSPVNLVFTVLMGCFFCYWLIVMIGMIDLDALDFEMDLDLDADVDAGAGGGAWMGVLKFLNVGEVPLMILLSVFVMVMWLMGVLAHMLIGAWSIGVQLIALLPMLVLAGLATKVLTHPARKLFAQLDEDAKAGSVTVLGQRCRVTSATVDDQFGQAEIETNASPVRINVKTPSKDVVLQRGEEAVVVIDRNEKGIYTIRGF